MIRLYLFLIFGTLVHLSCNHETDFVQPKVMDITESVYSSITLEPDSMYEVHSIATGLVDKVLVEEGELVKKGQILVRIQGEKVEYQKENAALSLQLAKDNLDGKSAILKDLKNQIELAELKYRNDSVNFNRQQRLHDKGVGSEIDYESRKLQFESSKNNLQLLQKQYIRNKNELETALRQAELNYQSNTSNVKDHLIISEINGKVYDVLVKEGELVNAQFPVALVGSAQDFKIEMLVDEVDIVRLSLGQEVIISLDAYKQDIFKAKVTKIYPNMNQRTQTFKVEGRFEQPPDVLYPGLSGEANIIIKKREDVLTIPIEYLGENNTLETDDGQVKIEIGVKSLTHVEILSGVDSTTHVFMPVE